MRKIVPVLIVSLLLVMPCLPETVAADDPYEEPTMTVVLPSSITPNSDISVKINIKNTTGTRMWRSKIYIDTNSIPNNIKQYLEFFETVDYPTKYLVQQGLKDVLYPDEEANINFRIRANSYIPALTIPIYIVLETEIGLCDEGCAPYKRTLQYDIVVIRNEPNLFLELDLDEVRLNVGDCYIAKGSFSVPYSITNTSQTSAFDVNLSVKDPQIPLSSTITPQAAISLLKPGESKLGIVYMATGNLSPGTYTIELLVTYADYYGKGFSTSDTFNIVVVSDAYALLEQGELYLLSCEYQQAISSFEDAMELYEDVGYLELSQRCYKRIELIYGILSFKEAQDHYHSGDMDSARTSYETAKAHYNNANDCTGTSLCQSAISAIDNQEDGTPNGSEGDSNGGLSMLEIVLIVTVLGLLGALVLVSSKKRS